LAHCLDLAAHSDDARSTTRTLLLAATCATDVKTDGPLTDPEFTR
jgi:hypothetical protein